MRGEIGLRMESSGMSDALSSRKSRSLAALPASRKANAPIAKAIGAFACRVGRVQRDIAPDRPTRRLAAELDDVLRSRALRALNHVELHGLALGEGLEAVSLNGGVVHEAILLAVRGGDEAKALRVVEPLHGAGRTHS